jgi:hypothetical protein
MRERRCSRSWLSLFRAKEWETRSAPVSVCVGVGVGVWVDGWYRRRWWW